MAVAGRGGVGSWGVGWLRSTHWIGLSEPVAASCPPFCRYCSAGGGTNTRQATSWQGGCKLGPTAVGRKADTPSGWRFEPQDATVIALGWLPDEALSVGGGDLRDHSASDVGWQPGERGRDGGALRLRRAVDALLDDVGGEFMLREGLQVVVDMPHEF